MNSVLALLPNDETKERVRAKSDREEVLRVLKAELYEELNKRAWVPWIQITKSTFPEVAGKPKRGGSGGRRNRGRDKKETLTVPAYKVSLLVAVKQQDNQTDSQNLIKKLIVDPLETKLKSNAGSSSGNKCRVT